MSWRRPNPLNIKNVGAESSLSKGVYRSRLQELSQKCGFGLPVYACRMEGINKFKATVKFNGQVFSSPDYCGSAKAAQHAAAEVAFTSVSKSQASSLRLLLAAKTKERALHKKGKDQLWRNQEVPNVVPPTNLPEKEKEITAETEFLRIPCQEDIECGCCFSDCPFEKMVQCADGHLFCFSCLRRHVEETLFGSSQISGGLSCIHTDGCKESFPRSEVLRVLPSELILKYERLQAEDAVTRAKLSGLVYCPFCNFPCELDPGISIFKCPYEKCGKQSCTKCREPNHLPLQCHEVEKKSETVFRRQVEEDMTQAIIRTCYACKAELVKDDGCNKITCRCGESICYVCRQPIKAYTHFCQHPRDPGKGCSKCKRCSLWEKENEDDVVGTAKDNALKALKVTAPSLLKRSIGPDITVGKRHKTV